MTSRYPVRPIDLAGLKTVSIFDRGGKVRTEHFARPYKPGDTLTQADLARTLQRIADQGPAGFYEGETAALIEKEMKANGGLITRDDLKKYVAKERAPLKGTYRGYEVIGMAPPSSGGMGIIQMLKLLRPIYRKTAAYGHFGRDEPEFTWEATDKADALRAAAGL